jgi:hypothetical protein
MTRLRAYQAPENQDLSNQDRDLWTSFEVAVNRWSLAAVSTTMPAEQPR